MTAAGLAAGAVLLFYVLRKYNFSEVMAAVAAAGWGIALISVFRFATITTDAAGWRELWLPPNKPRPAQLFVYRWIGEAVNTLLPVAQVGGHVARARLLGRTQGDYVTAGGSTIVDFTLGVLTQAIYTTAGIAFLLPLARAMRFPETVGGGDMHFEAADLQLSIAEQPAGTRLRAGFHTRAGRHLEAEVLVTRPAGHETLNVVIPWSDRCFQFTSKQNTRPALGSAVLDGKTYRFDAGNHAYGCLDFGRGIWPYRTCWNWGAASGLQEGRVVGLNLGGQWTDGTGMTENGLCIDGRLHKISEPLVWEYDRTDFRRPWRIRAPQTRRVDLQFTPTIEESQRFELGLVGTELHWVLGHFNGTVVTDGGETLGAQQLLGWAEEHRARW